MNKKQNLIDNILRQVKSQIQVELDNYKSVYSPEEDYYKYFDVSYKTTNFEDLNEIFKNNTIELRDLTFYQIQKNPDDDYLYLLNKLYNIEFVKCDFFQRGLGFITQTVYYRECTFKSDYIVINNCNYFEKKLCLYELCTFESEVTFSPICRKFTTPLFKRCTFNDSIDSDRREFTKEVFVGIDNKFNRYSTELRFQYCTFSDDFILKNNKLKRIDFEQSVFMKKVKLIDCEIKNTNFKRTKFYDLVGFEKTSFENAEFKNSRFYKLVRFKGSIFEKKIDFKHTYFMEHVIFNEMKLHDEINIEESFFTYPASFLNIMNEREEIYNIKVSNRETARIIKDSFEQHNNIIDANRFYALEMKEREKELKWGKDFFEKLIFSIHGWSSNHSQDWILSLFWIVYFTFSILMLENNQNLDTVIPVITVLGLGIIISSNFDTMIRSILLFVLAMSNYVLYFAITKDSCLHNFANKLNPFSIMNGWDDLNFSNFIYKVVIAYLIYQLIISIRQNTRRK